MELLFWASLGCAFFAYFGYPLVLLAWGALRRSKPIDAATDDAPAVSMILPVHNEEGGLPAKLQNIFELDYPADRLEVLVVSDGSTDRTVEIVREAAEQRPQLRLIEETERKGKGNGLNVGIANATHELIVFTDAGIILEPGSLKALVAGFADPTVGCISGEDVIPEMGGEGLYGRYELFLRRKESAIHSIVGASGSFYAQRKAACPEFVPGIAPDFLSVLHAVEMGYRAQSEEAARGTMGAVRSHGDEFKRKVRTLVRGMSGLTRYAHLLNPFKYGAFAFLLGSHKLMRWLVPFFLLTTLVANLALLDQPLYAALAVPHLLFYLLAAISLLRVPALSSTLPARIAGYFFLVNAAIVAAWWAFLRGARPEVWAPSRR